MISRGVETKRDAKGKEMEAHRSILVELIQQDLPNFRADGSGFVDESGEDVGHVVCEGSRKVVSAR